MALNFEDDETDDEEFDVDFEEDPHTHTKGEFFGCYLLVSTNPRYKGQTYIGFTVDPNRRIKQHNAGHHMGGAKKTSGRGPWEMILIVHGFPNDTAALRFEWAWQHPAKSRRLRNAVTRKRSRETSLQHRFRILTEMLSVGPWWRLPLTIRWLKQEYEIPFPLKKQPPVHMPITYGLVGFSKPGGAVKEAGLGEVEDEEEEEECEDELGKKKHVDTVACCSLCSEELKAEMWFHCYHVSCSMSAHAVCLAPKLCETDHVVPVSGPCPSCGRELLWGELARRRKATERMKENEQDQSSQPVPKRRHATKLTQPVPKRRNATKSTQKHWTEALHVQ